MKRLQEDSGPFTVFAPSNAAFDKWGPGERRAIERKEQRLGDIVRYHIVVGQPVRTLVVPEDEPVSMATLGGLKLLAEAHEIKKNQPTISLNGQANVTEANLGPFSNGFVHVINGVLAYPGWLPAGNLAQFLKAQQNQLSLRVFMNLISQDPEFINLAASGPFTVFAPADTAFLKVGLCTKPPMNTGMKTPITVRLSRMMPKDRELVKRILRFHIVPGHILNSTELARGGRSRTLDTGNGDASALSFQELSSGINLNLGGANVNSKKMNYLSSNGVLHMIDAVLLPPGLALPDVAKSRQEYKGQVQQMVETPVPPEPSPIELLDFSEGMTKLAVERVVLTERQHYAVLLVALVLVVFIFWGLQRLTAPRESFDAPDAEDPERKRSKSPRPASTSCLSSFFCVLSVIGILSIPLFSATDWMLPDGARSAARQLRSTAASMLRRKKAAPTTQQSEHETYTAAAEASAQGSYDLAEALSAYNKSISVNMTTRLLNYGIDRLELLARADHDDRDRLRFRDHEVWDTIVSEARRRTGWEPESTPAPTPAPRALGMGAVKQSPDLMQQWNTLIAGIQKKNEGVHSKPDFTAFFPTTKKGQITTPAPPTPPPTMGMLYTPPPTPADPDAGKPKLIVGLISVPFGGDDSIECTIGSRHGKFDPRDDTINERVHLVARSTMKEVTEAAVPGAGKKSAKTAKVITATLLRDPLNRAALAFQSALGRPNEQTKFRCKGKLARVLAQPGYTIDEYSRLSPQVRALCESARNVVVKSLTDAPFDMPATQENLDAAKLVLQKKLTTFFLHENMDKSMYMLRRELGDTYMEYVSCSPYKSDLPNLSQRAQQVLSEENRLDLELFDYSRQLWWTTWAGKYEDNFQEPSCEGTPRVCFDDNDKNQEKKMKVPYDKSHILMRGNAPKSIMCASKCAFTAKPV